MPVNENTQAEAAAAQLREIVDLLGKLLVTFPAGVAADEYLHLALHYRESHEWLVRVELGQSQPKAETVTAQLAEGDQTIASLRQALAVAEQRRGLFDLLCRVREQTARPNSSGGGVVIEDDLVIVRDETVPREVAKVRADRALRMHPLTAVHFEYEGDPFARLEASREYVVDRAHRELDELENRIRASHHAEVDRMLAWVHFLSDYAPRSVPRFTRIGG